MSKNRSQRRTHGGQRRAPGARSALVRLAQGVTLLDGGAEDCCVLVGPGGKVQLNDGATTILRLCDGSRSSDEIITAVVQSSPKPTLAADVAAFLDVARARGWIVSLDA